MNRRSAALALIVLLAGCNPPEYPAAVAVEATGPPFRDLPPPLTATTTSAVAIQRPMLQTASSVAAKAVHLSSTAYCETGRMANGQRTYSGAVAGNRWPLGTILQVSDGPNGPGRYIVADRIGHGSELDFAIPGDCPAARRWGRRTVTVEVIR